MKYTLGMMTLLLGLIVPSNVSGASSSFTKIDARGTGCPLGTTDIVKSPDGESVSILFNEMLIELPQFDGDNDNDSDLAGHGRASRFNKNLVQKICNILVEADIPGDHKVDSIDLKVDYRGSTFMEKGTTAFFHSQLVNLEGPGRRKEPRRDFVVRKIWREGPQEEDWTITGERNIKVQSNCSRRGDSKHRFNLRNIIRANILPLGERLDSYVFIGLDTADLVGKLELKINSSICRGRGGRPARPIKPGRGNGRGRGNPRVGPVGNCPPGLAFHAPTRRCLTKRQIVLMGRR